MLRATAQNDLRKREGEPASDTLRWGILGTGGIARAFARELGVEKAYGS